MRKWVYGLLVFAVLSGCQGEQASGDSQNTPKEKDVQKATGDASGSKGLLEPDRILNIAHRGASGYAPEHTLSAYQKGEEMVGDYIEIDLQMTKDGTLIAMHDADVSRTTDGEGLVKDFTLADIKALDAGSWFNNINPEVAQPAFSQAVVPTLDEIFDTFGDESNYYIETKTPEEYPDMVDTLIGVLKEHGFLETDIPEGKVIIQSFSEASLKDVHELAPSLPLIQLLSYKDTASISKQELEHIKTYAVGVGPSYKYITKDYVATVRDAGLLIHPYTVNETEDMKRLIEWGVTGMFTNYPDRLNEVIEGID